MLYIMFNAQKNGSTNKNKNISEYERVNMF